MACPFCCLLEDHIGQFVNIGFVVNCCLDNPTPPVNHVYGAGFITRNSICGDIIRLYNSPIGGYVIFTGHCNDIFELHFPQFGNNDVLGIEELNAKAAERIDLFNTLDTVQEEEKANV